MIVEVAFNLPIERTFHYLIPPELEAASEPGRRVIAPFGPRERLGVIVARPGRSPLRALKPIRRVVDPVPVVAGDRWALASWVAEHYCCSLGEALAVMVPSQLRLAHGGSGEAAAPRPADGEPAASGLTLTAHQRRALDAVTDALEDTRRRPGAGRSEPRTILLHGVTGSGKTELYLRAIEGAASRGRSAICLVPEISLTPQTTDRFRERFGQGVAVWHSRLSAGQRAAEWMRLAGGACRVVVGARSAVFAPVVDLGLIVIDEEQEETYKHEGSPRYDAREVARARARLTGAVIVLGSATPSVESYFAATRGRNRLVTLPERVEGRALPAVEIIDMREELAARRGAGPLSHRLARCVEQALTRGEQAMLLLNRRGFARVAQCRACGVVVRCGRCAVPLVYHALRRELVCHYCNLHETPTELCAQCRTGSLRFRGAGTERVESELHRLFPAASIARMDRDTTRSRDSHRRIYDAVKAGRVGVLVGTQMIAKGLDFPQVTLVGVVSADTALNLPDFRAGERTFDLLTQVAGRAGRGAQPGRVLIQTFCPGHYAIRAAQQHDYRRFYEEEIRMRRRLRLPPFVRLVELMVVGSSRQRVEEAADRLAAALRHSARRRGITLLGPAPHRVARLRRTYRVCLILKARAVGPILALLRRTLSPGRRFAGMPVIVNVDPR